MAKTFNQKMKLLHILRVLNEKTDENHYLTAAQLIEELEKVGIRAERKSIYSDINELTDYGYDIIHVAFSSALSGSYNNVCMVAKELLEEYTNAKITVIDSLTASLAETMMVIHANELRENGASYEEVVNALEALKMHLNLQFLLHIDQIQIFL